MPPSVIRRAIGEFPINVSFAGAYGQTETTSTVAVLDPDDHRGEKDIFGPHAMVFNYNHIYGIDCLDADDLSRGVIEGREIAIELLEYLRETVPGFKTAALSTTGILLGVRETRRIRGDFILETPAYFESHRHEDDIAVYDYALDLHAAQASKNSQEDYYDIYYDYDNYNDSYNDNYYN